MQNQKSHYHKTLKDFARKLRNSSTLGESILWKEVLRAKKMCVYQFNRQFALKFDNLNIIVDFICRQLKLIIEVDGYSHNFKYDDDLHRDKILEEHGYTVLRFTEFEVRNDLQNVIRNIEIKIESLEQPIPPAPPEKSGQAFAKGESSPTGSEK